MTDTCESRYTGQSTCMYRVPQSQVASPAKIDEIDMHGLAKSFISVCTYVLALDSANLFEIIP